MAHRTWQEQISEGRRRAAQSVADFVNAALSTDVATKVDRWLRDVVDARPSAVSRLMDAEYIRTHIGGGWHRLFDGGHDLWGAWKAVTTVHPQDNLLKNMGIYFAELWKDLATPNGLPVITLNKASFDAVASALGKYLGVSPGWVYDMATVTASEFAGAGVAVMAVLVLDLEQRDPERYLEMCASFGVSAIGSGNPILLAVAFALAIKAARRRNRLSRWVTIAALARGTATVGLMIACIAVLGPFGLLIAIPVAMVLRAVMKRLARGRIVQVGRGAVLTLQAQLTSRIPGPESALRLSGPAAPSR